MDNTVELLGYYGSDLTHAQSAWTSTSRDLDEEKIARIPKLLDMLATAGHHTPFEKSTFHFLVNSDIASHIHLLKHRIGVSINAESARYKELKEDKFFIPKDWEDLPVSDTGAKIFGGDWQTVLANYSKIGNELYHRCIEDLVAAGVPRKRAKESARFFKAYNSQISCDITFNFRSFVHFLGLRNKEAAQKEIREIAAEMLSLVKNLDGNPFEHTIKAFKL